MHLASWSTGSSSMRSRLRDPWPTRTTAHWASRCTLKTPAETSSKSAGGVTPSRTASSSSPAEMAATSWVDIRTAPPTSGPLGLITGYSDVWIEAKDLDWAARFYGELIGFGHPARLDEGVRFS